MRSIEERGYLVFERHFDMLGIDQVLEAIETQLQKSGKRVVVDDLRKGGRTFLALSDFPQHRHFKFNDLYLENDAVRRMALDPTLVAALADSLGDEPVLVNSLYFEQSSTQGRHIDSLYMTPRTPGNVIATWTALEDVHPDAGPLRYWPGSHQIPLHRFSDGTHHAINEEMDTWQEYIDHEIAARGIEPVEFLARCGDVFIWHANLAHAGGNIVDRSRTRKSLVCHYYTRTDCEAHGWGDQLRSLNGASWLARLPPPVTMAGTDWLDRMPFPERSYLERNPDVAAAVDRGDFASGLEHYRAFGHGENRKA